MLTMVSANDAANPLKVSCDDTENVASSATAVSKPNFTITEDKVSAIMNAIQRSIREAPGESCDGDGLPQNVRPLPPCGGSNESFVFRFGPFVPSFPVGASDEEIEEFKKQYTHDLDPSEGDSESFAVRYWLQYWYEVFTRPDLPEKIFPFHPLWSSSGEDALDFLRNVLPSALSCGETTKQAGKKDDALARTLALYHNVDAAGLSPLARDILHAALTDDATSAEQLLTCSPSGESTAAAALGVAAAARWGNWRVLQRLCLSCPDSATVRDASGVLPVTLAAKGRFVPAVEVLVGSKARDWTPEDLEAMELTEEEEQQLQLAAHCVEKLRSETAAEGEGVMYGAAASHLCNAQTFDVGLTGPTALVHPRGGAAARDFEVQCRAMSKGEEYDAYVAHSWAGPTPEEKAALLRKHFESKGWDLESDPGAQPRVYLDEACLPKHDGRLKWAIVHRSFHGAILTSRRCVCVLSPFFLKSFWCLEELLVFAKLQGYGAVTATCPDGTTPSSQLLQLLRDAPTEQMGINGGPAPGLGVFACHQNGGAASQ